MRLLVLGLLALAVAAPASAATPRFGVFDLSGGLARASHNSYGDVSVAKSEAALARRARGAVIVRCGADCRLGRGWLAFAQPSSLALRDVVSAKAHPAAFGWGVTVGLTARGAAAWARVNRTAFAREKRNGVPDVFAVVLNGTILALPYASAVHQKGTTLELSGFTPAGARAAVQILRRRG